MSGKLKMSLVVLVLAAGTSLWYLFSLLGPGSMADAPPQTATALDTFSVLDDEDGDGLSNKDETLWRTNWRNPDTDGDGFTDGEEVLAGHDPTKAGPNDFLDPSKNLTDYTSTLLLGGILSGDISSTSASQQLALQQVADVVFDEYQKFALAPRSVQVKTVPDSIEALAAYGDAMKEHWEGTIPSGLRLAEEYLGRYGSVDSERSRKLTESDDENQQLVAASLELEASLLAYADRLADVPTPQSMVRAHQNGIVLFQHMAEQAAIAGTLRNDPVKAVLANTMLAGLIERTAVGFLYDYITTLETLSQSYVDAETL